MKKLMLGLLVLSTMSSFASSAKADSLEFTIDWERIERGMETGDFSCKGTCATLSIDWNETWQTVSGQKYLNQRKSNIAYCISEYQKAKNTQDDIAIHEANNEISSETAAILSQMNSNSVKSVDLVCESRLGKRKALNLKNGILNN